MSSGHGLSSSLHSAVPCLESLWDSAPHFSSFQQLWTEVKEEMKNLLLFHDLNSGPPPDFYWHRLSHMILNQSLRSEAQCPLTWATCDHLEGTRVASVPPTLSKFQICVSGEGILTRKLCSCYRRNHWLAKTINIHCRYQRKKNLRKSIIFLGSYS